MDWQAWDHQPIPKSTKGLKNKRTAKKPGWETSQSNCTENKELVKNFEAEIFERRNIINFRAQKNENEYPFEKNY